MRCLILVVSITLLSCAAACGPNYKQPAYPNNVPGWKEHDYPDGGHSIGKLVLRKGESSDNGTIGVTVVNILSPELLAEPWSYRGSPRVVLRLFKPSDRQTSCEITFSIANHLLRNYKCSATFGLSGINIYSINTKEGWVYFELLGSE